MIDINYDYSKIYFEQNKDKSGANGVSDEQKGEEKISLTDIIDLIENGDFDVLNSLNVNSITRYTDKSGRSIVSFKYDNIKYTFTVTGVADANKDNIDIDDILESLETGDTSLLDSIGCNYTKASDKSGRAVIIFEYDGIKYSVYINNPKAGSVTSTEGGNNTAPTFITFQEADLAGLEQAAIDKYLVKQEDGTYTFNVKALNADFPDKQITTIDQLKEAIALQKSQEETNSFATWNDMHSWLQAGAKAEFEAEYQDIGFKTGCQAAANVANNHKTDFNTISRKALLEELHAEYLRLYPNEVIKKTESTDDGDETFADFGKLKLFATGSEAKEAVEKELGYEITQSDLNTIGGQIAENHRDNPKDVTKTQIIKELVAAFQELAKQDEPDGANGTDEAQGTGSTGATDTDGSNDIPQPDNFTGKFEHIGQLQTYVHREDVMAYVFAQAGEKIDPNEYGHLAYEVAQKHEKDINSVTVESIITELVDAIKAKVAAAGPNGANGTDEAQGTGSTGATDTDGSNDIPQPDNFTGKFEHIGQLQTYVHREDVMAYVFAQAGEKIDPNEYGHLAYEVAQKHEKDINSVTVESIITELVDAIKAKVAAAGPNGANGTDESQGASNSAAVTFQEADLAGLEQAAIDKYFIKQEDGTYIFNEDAIKADFPDKQITTILQLKFAIRQIKMESNFVPTTYTLDELEGLTEEEIDKYFIELNGRYSVNIVQVQKDLGIPSVKLSPQDIKDAIKLKASIETAIDKFKSNGYNLAPEPSDDEIEAFELQLKAKCSLIYLRERFADTNQRTQENIDNWVLASAETVVHIIERDRITNSEPAKAARNALDALNKNDSSAIRGNRISSTISSLEQEYASNHNQTTKINTAYSLDANGNITFKDSYVKTMYNDLFAHIKEVVGTDGFDEKTLKALYQSAWEMTYTKYQIANENDISDFLNEVYSNFKQILTRINNKPEYLEIFAPEQRAAVGLNSRTGTVQRVNCDSNPQEYDGTIHVSDDKSDKILQDAIAQLKQELQAKYPNLPSAKLTSMVNAAVKEAITNIANNNTSKIPQSISTNNPAYAYITINKLAAYYFEQNLMKAALTDSTLLDGNPEPTAAKSIEVTDADKTKWQNASDSINKVLSKYTTSKINDVLVAGDCSGTHSLHMDVSSDGTINFADSATQKAYDKLFASMQEYFDLVGTGLSNTELKNVYRAAWLATYSTYNNNQSYDLSEVLTKVVANMKKILNKLKTNPEYYTIIQTGSAMTQDWTDTTSIHYGGTDTSVNWADGDVHLSNDDSDKKYQAAIEKLRTALKGKYVPPLSEYQFNIWFTNAQKDAIRACLDNSRDITKDLVYSDGTRHKDGSNIQIGQLMELIAYKFDKYVYRNLLS